MEISSFKKMKYKWPIRIWKNVQDLRLSKLYRDPISFCRITIKDNYQQQMLTRMTEKRNRFTLLVRIKISLDTAEFISEVLSKNQNFHIISLSVNILPCGQGVGECRI